MRHLAARVLRSRIAGNVSANIYNQSVQVGIQLLSVPVLSAHWGLKAYGAWLMLFTIPSYLAMADLGFASAAGNDMIMRVARGDRHGAATTFLALESIVLGMTAAVLVLAAAMVYLVVPHLLDFAQPSTGGTARATVLILIGYGLASLQSSVVGAGYRATDGYATALYIYVTVMLLEALCALAFVIAGYGPLQAALAYLVVRSLGTAVLAIILYRRTPWLFTIDWRGSTAHVRPLLEPAVGALAIPAAQALSLQGAVVLIGSVLGPATVPLFTTIRTLTRTALQFTFMVNLSAMPAFTVAAATRDRQRQAQLLLACFLTSLALLLPAAPALLLAGRPIILFWTHGRIEPPLMLLVLMTAGMLLNGAWMPLSNFILAVNAHKGFSYYYLLASAGCIALSYPLAQRLGVDGVGVALILLEAIMLRRVFRLGRSLGVLDPAALRSALAASVAALRRSRAGAPREP